jgi:PhnB protein
MTIVPYLTFGGNCREALTFYQSVLAGELHLETFGDSAVAAQLPAEMANHIMHGHLTTGSLSLMASDTPETFVPQVGNVANLMLICTSDAEINQKFAALSESGKVGHPLEDTFWNARFGTLTDKFGINWMLHLDKAQAA